MANRLRWVSLAVACVPAVLAAAACGGDTDEPSGTGGGGGTGGSAGSVASDASVGRETSSTGGSGGTGGSAGAGGTTMRPPDCGDAGISCPPEGNQNRDRVLCDAPRSRCVECLGESDCATQMGQNGEPGETHCNIEQGRCRQCVFGNPALGCPAGRTCQENGNCEPTCATDADCAVNMEDRACNPATMTCTECLTDAHCATNMNEPACDVAETECVECNTNAHCAMRPNAATQPICDPMEHECEQCLVDADCATRPGTPFCRTNGNTCVACRTLADCPTGATSCSGGNAGRCVFPSDGGMTDGAPAPATDARTEAATNAPRDAALEVSLPTLDAAGQ